MTEGIGQKIMQESFAIIERGLDRNSFPPWAFVVVRRMIHASADFEFAQTLRYSDDFDSAFRKALGAQTHIVTDTEMVLQGIQSWLRRVPGKTPISYCYLNGPMTAQWAAQEGLTRSAAGISMAADNSGVAPSPILVIGNSPTALEEAVHQVEVRAWRPSVIIGMPVGFVGVEEAKLRLLSQSKVPYLTCVGRKGGSAVAAAALNGLIEWCCPEKAETLRHDGLSHYDWLEAPWIALPSLTQHFPRLKIWNYPSFDDWKAWCILSPSPVGQSLPPLLREVTYPRLSEPYEPYPTLKVRDVALSRQRLNQVLETAAALAVPVAGRKDCQLGMDGESSGFEFYDSFGGSQTSLTMKWWSEGPAEWRPLTAWVSELRTSFQVLLDQAG
jgi:precorrin-8X/cobalt-precorrin-8 methylmutase